MKCKIHNREMVCLSCMMTKVGKMGGQSRSAAKLAAGRENILKAAAVSAKARRKPNVYGTDDALATIKKAKGPVNAKYLIERAPADKQESAKRYVHHAMHRLVKKGLVERAGWGLFQYIHKQS